MVGNRGHKDIHRQRRDSKLVAAFKHMYYVQDLTEHCFITRRERL